MSNVVELRPKKEDESIPAFINPTDLDAMSDEQIDALLEGIRMRRMQKQVLYAETLKLKDEAAKRGIEDKFSRKLAQLSRGIEVINKSLDKLDRISNEIQGLRIQLGAEPL